MSAFAGLGADTGGAEDGGKSKRVLKMEASAGSGCAMGAARVDLCV